MDPKKNKKKKKHKHSHVKESHSHSSHAKDESHSHDESKNHDSSDKEDVVVDPESLERKLSHSDDSHSHKMKRAKNVNIQGAFLHVLGDLFGSIAAIASGLTINFFTFDARYYFDPIASLLIVIIIFISAIKLVLTCIKTLMQSVPNDVDLASLRSDIKNVEGIYAVHDLHVWKLVGNKVIGTVHIVCVTKSVIFMDIAVAVKKIFHKHGIHSSTIQPEFIKKNILKEPIKECQLDCGKNKCIKDSCCPPLKLEAVNQEQFDQLFSNKDKK